MSGDRSGDALVVGTTGPPTTETYCLLAHLEAEVIKNATIAFRSVIPGLRVEAVFSADEAVAWAAKEAWQTILFAEHLVLPRARSERPDLATILGELRARSPFSAIIVLGQQDDAGIGLMLAGPAADYYWTRRLGHAPEELAMLAVHLAEKHALRRQLHAAWRAAADQDLTMQLLGNLTALLQSLGAYYEADRRARLGAPTDERDADVSRKITEVEEALVDLHGRLQMRRQRDERARSSARGDGFLSAGTKEVRRTDGCTGER